MIYDITPPLSPRLTVWPGDTPLSREILCDMRRGDNITLSTIHCTAHLGAHADAPSHYGRDAAAIHERNIDFYLGPCQVVHVQVPRMTLIGRSMLPNPIRAPRVLVATGTYPNPESFNPDFAALSPVLVESLHAEGVRLIGIDTPSVDLFDSKELPAHKMFLQFDMAILEGIVLHEVPDGIYELVALPLKLVDFDASPVRAILRTMS